MHPRHRAAAGRARLLLIAAVLAPVACVPDAPGSSLPLGAESAPPPPPRDLRAVNVRSTSIDLEWTAAGDSSEVDFYRVYRGGARVDSSHTHAFSDEDLEPYTTYEYSVASVRGERESESSEPLRTRTLDDSPPSEPEDLESEHVSGSRVDLVWSAAEDSESGVDHYRVFRGDEQIGTADITSYSDTTVEPLKIYSYTVSAVNGDELEGEESEGVLVFTSR